MDKNELNKCMCEELFGGMLEVTVLPNCFEKSNARWQKKCLYETLQIAMKRISTIEEMVQKMDEFCRIKKPCPCQLERVTRRYCTNWSNSAKIPNTRRAGPNHYPLLGEIPHLEQTCFPPGIGGLSLKKWINSRKSREYSPKNLENKWITYILGNFPHPLFTKILHFRVNILFLKGLGDFPQKMDKFHKKLGIYPKNLE